MLKSAIKLTPSDQGRQMALADFETAEAADGKLYELGRGIVTVTDVPGKPHLVQFLAIRQQLLLYQAANAGKLYGVMGGSECKVLIAASNSERHPDLAVYTTPPPNVERDSELWSVWIPALVVEIVSPGSSHRDYVEKREEYLQFGIREYWIVDSGKQEMLALQRSRGQWHEQVVRPPATYRSLELPGFEFNLAAVFAAQ